jgi:hypothetical protein
VLIADKVLWPLVENFRERVGFEHVVAIGDGPTPDGAIEYEDLVASGEDDLPAREIDERAAAAVLHERYDRAAEGRPTPTARSPSTRWRGDGGRAAVTEPTTSASRSSRCFTRTHGASRSRAR